MDDSQGRLLIVEDDSALRRSLRTTLDVMGFDVGEASNGEDGLVRLRMVDYEALLLDINMPGIRKKLEADAANPLYILTDSYIGYRFREP